MPAQAGDLIHTPRLPFFNGGQDPMIALTYDIGLNGVMFQISFDPFGLAETHRRLATGSAWIMCRSGSMASITVPP